MIMNIAVRGVKLLIGYNEDSRHHNPVTRHAIENEWWLIQLFD
jgi:hypothetical protein